MAVKLVAPSWLYAKKEEVKRLFDDPTWGSRATVLTVALEAAVPLWQLRIVQRDGPNDTDWYRCREFAWDIASYGDRLMFRESKPKEGPSTAEMFNRLAECTAIMSFLPGGITLFGRRWEMDKESEEYSDLSEAIKRAREYRRKKPTIKRKRRS